jgi:hydrogenase-4 component E
VTGLLIAFMITLLLPLFIGTWRTSFLGLAVQGALLSSIAYRQHGSHLSLESGLLAFDLVGLRMIAVPVALYLVLRARNAPLRNDVIAPNLFSWAMALALVVLAFQTADVLVPTEGDEQMMTAVASAAFLLGMFVLSTGRGPASQIIGLVRVENAIALFELGSGSDHESLAVRMGQSAVLLVSIGFYRWYLLGLSREEPAADPARVPAL